MDIKIIDNNKKAFHDYEVLETCVAGIVLEGNEIKSIRKNKVNLKGTFCRFFKNELFVLDLHIKKYENSNLWKKTEESQNRKLLMTRKQLDKFNKAVQTDGMTIVPLKIFFNEHNKCKIEIGLCKGKNNYDKRQSLKEKDIKKDIDRELKNKFK